MTEPFARCIKIEHDTSYILTPHGKRIAEEVKAMDNYLVRHWLSTPGNRERFYREKLNKVTTYERLINKCSKCALMQLTGAKDKTPFYKVMKKHNIDADTLCMIFILTLKDHLLQYMQDNKDTLRNVIIEH